MSINSVETDISTWNMKGSLYSAYHTNRTSYFLVTLSSMAIEMELSNRQTDANSDIYKRAHSVPTVHKKGAISISCNFLIFVFFCFTWTRFKTLSSFRKCSFMVPEVCEYERENWKRGASRYVYSYATEGLTLISFYLIFTALLSQ